MTSFLTREHHASVNQSEYPQNVERFLVLGPPLSSRISFWRSLLEKWFYCAGGAWRAANGAATLNEDLCSDGERFSSWSFRTFQRQNEYVGEESYLQYDVSINWIRAQELSPARSCSHSLNSILRVLVRALQGAYCQPTGRCW